MTRILDFFGRRERPAPRRSAPAAATEPLAEASFRGLHAAAHREDSPESNKDIDPDGSDRNGLEALRWKQAFAERADVDMAIATRFRFEVNP